MANPELDFGGGAIIQNWTSGGHNPGLDFGGPYLCFLAKSFLTALFSIGNTTFWGPLPPAHPGSAPGNIRRLHGYFLTVVLALP